MTLWILPVAIALTRGWLRVYTCRLPRPLADARRAEIESDLWEMQHDPDLERGLAGGAIALARLVEGIASDIAWRVDQADVEEQFIVRRLLALTAATALVLSLCPVPSLVVEGHQRVEECAAEAPRPKTRAALQHEVIRCTGAFFSSPR